MVAKYTAERMNCTDSEKHSNFHHDGGCPICYMLLFELTENGWVEKESVSQTMSIPVEEQIRVLQENIVRLERLVNPNYVVVWAPREQVERILYTTKLLYTMVRKDELKDTCPHCHSVIIK